MFLQYSACVPGIFTTLASGNRIILHCRMLFLVASSPEEARSFPFEVRLPASFPLIFQSCCVTCRKTPSSLWAHPLACDALLSLGCSFPLGYTAAPQGRSGLFFPSHGPSGLFSWKEHNISLEWANQMLSFTLRTTTFWWVVLLLLFFFF